MYFPGIDQVLPTLEGPESVPPTGSRPSTSALPATSAQEGPVFVQFRVLGAHFGTTFRAVLAPGCGPHRRPSTSAGDTAERDERPTGPAHPDQRGARGTQEAQTHPNGNRLQFPSNANFRMHGLVRIIPRLTGTATRKLASGRFWRCSSQFRANSPPTFGRPRPTVGRIRATCGRIWCKLAQHRSNSAQMLPFSNHDFSESRPKFGRSRANSGPHSTDVG